MPCIDAKQESKASDSLAAPGTSQILPCEPTPFACLRKELNGNDIDFIAEGAASQLASGTGVGCISGVLLPSTPIKSRAAKETSSDSGHSSPVQHSPASLCLDDETADAAARNCCVPAGIKVEIDFDDCLSDDECGLHSDQEDSSCGTLPKSLGDVPFEDDFGELTSLAWLLDGNLLRNLSATGDREHRKHRKQPLDSATTASFVQADSEGTGSVNYTAEGDCCFAASPSSSAEAQQSWQRGGEGSSSKKPPFSFACLIFMAIEESPSGCLPVTAIYEWISRNFPYYQSAPNGWKNSVRHNLSLNKCFRKLDRDILRLARNSKGACWCIDPLYRPNLLQALRRTPYYGNQQMQLLALANTVSRPTARLSGEVSTNTVWTRAVPRGLDIEAANALVSLRVPAVKREYSPDSASPNDGERLLSSSDSYHDFSSASVAKQQRFFGNEYYPAKVKSLHADVTDAPSSDHTYTVAPPSAADRWTHQQPSQLSSSEASRVAAAYEQGQHDSTQSRGGTDDSSNGEALELFGDRSTSALARSSAARDCPTVCPCYSTKTCVTSIASSAADRLCNSGYNSRLRGRIALQAYSRAVTCGGRSTYSANSKLQSTAASATRDGASISSSLLSLASAASLAMMDDNLVRSRPSH